MDDFGHGMYSSITTADVSKLNKKIDVVNWYKASYDYLYLYQHKGLHKTFSLIQLGSKVKDVKVGTVMSHSAQLVAQHSTKAQLCVDVQCSGSVPSELQD